MAKVYSGKAHISYTPLTIGEKVKVHNIVSFGGGTNSTAVLVGLFERGVVPDAIWFADTMGEKPHTYEHIEEVNKWCEKVGFPKIEILREKYWTPQMIEDGSLENECLRRGSLPSKAYGYGTCSIKWKLDPQKKRMKQYIQENNLNLQDMFHNIKVLVGFDADEFSRIERAKNLEKEGKTWAAQRFPLSEWEWDRDDCISAIKRAGLKQPGKSACFYCPSTKKKELIQLRQEHPDLLARAIEIERKAMAGEGSSEASRCGLGRSFAWSDYLRQGELAICEFGQPESDCMCNDG